MYIASYAVAKNSIHLGIMRRSRAFMEHAPSPGKSVRRASGMVARSLNGTGRINLGQGAVPTVQGVGASLSSALGGRIAQWIGYGPAFLVLGGLGLLSVAIWIAFRSTVRLY